MTQRARQRVPPLEYGAAIAQLGLRVEQAFHSDHGQHQLRRHPGRGGFPLGPDLRSEMQA